MVIHDFSGHPFQVQLARQLATRGYEVIHLYCPSFQTPHGDVGVAEDGAAFRSLGVALRKDFSKYSFLRRLVQEAEYGIRLIHAVRSQRPAAVVSSNSPLMAAAIFQIGMKLFRIPVVFWQQDVYSTAMAKHVEAKAGPAGRWIGVLFILTERVIARGSAAVVAISADFVPTLHGWGVSDDRIRVIENWAPLDELPLRPRPNQWSERHDVGNDQVVVLYAGTLGFKHQPSLLLDVARGFANRPDVRVMVASEGVGATWLREQASVEDGLELFGFQPYEDLPDMLGTADVVLVLLEPDAGAFSVPSKVLTYHCAGRAIVASVPAENLAARIIEANVSGIVVDPSDATGFVNATRSLVDDQQRREAMGASGRAYAERTFDIARIGDEFVAVLVELAGVREPAAS